MTTPNQPGWYDDPHDANAQRYWDGQDWTPHRQRKAASRPARASAMPASPEQPPPPPNSPPSAAAAPTQPAPMPAQPPPAASALTQPAPMPTLPPPSGYNATQAGQGTGIPAQPPSGYGTPPPPPPGYGAPPPPPYGYGQPPASPGYPQQPGYGSQFSVGDAFSWAWNKFGKHGAQVVVPVLIYGLAMAALAVVLFLITMAFGVLDIGASVDTTSTDGYDTSSAAGGIGFFGFLFVMSLVAFFFLVAFLYIQAAYLSGCLDIADGKPVTIGSFFRPRNFGTVILTALLVAVLTAIGILFCILPGIIFAFLAMFAIAFVVDRSLSPVEALKASIATVRSNVGNALLSYLVQALVMWVGGLVLYVGLLVGAPLAALIQVYTYRRLSGGQVAPLTP